MIGIIVSGRAVPTAARTDPTAPSASSSFRPNHSMPFVDSSAPSRMTTKAIARTSRSAGRYPWRPSAATTDRAMTPRIARATPAMARSPRTANTASSPITRAMGVAIRMTMPAHR